jgi:hypothetical protein
MNCDDSPMRVTDASFPGLNILDDQEHSDAYSLHIYAKERQLNPRTTGDLRKRDTHSTSICLPISSLEIPALRAATSYNSHKVKSLGLWARASLSSGVGVSKKL